MKKTITEFLRALSDEDFSILDEIVESKYRKFLQMYWILKDYSDDITTLKYKVTSKDKLKIEVRLKNGKLDDVFNALSSATYDNVEITSDKKRIYLKIEKEEIDNKNKKSSVNI